MLGQTDLDLVVRKNARWGFGIVGTASAFAAGVWLGENGGTCTGFVVTVGVVAASLGLAYTVFPTEFYYPA